MNSTTSLERRIVIGLVVSDVYTQKILRIWNLQYLQSIAAKRIAQWCLDYFIQYQRAPKENIEDIFYEKLRKGLPKDVAEEIEEDILPGLSEEYEAEEQFNVEYLLDQTRAYFRERHLTLHTENIQYLVQKGDLLEAEERAQDFRNTPSGVEVGLDLSSESANEEVESAFNQTVQRMVSYPGSLGKIWNDQLVRGGFVALMGPEKRGKTFWLMDIGMRAIIHRSNVAFFQAGDMTKQQQLRRICIYLARKSDKAKYCGSQLLPVKDCLLHQIDYCDRKEREDSEGSGFLPTTESFQPGQEWINKARKCLTVPIIKENLKQYPEYQPCHNCKKWARYGSLYFRYKQIGNPLDATQAKDALSKFFGKYKRRLKLSTHANQTLSIKEIRSILDIWEDEDGFVPDVILVDYADLLVPSTRTEFRHQQNDIWMGLRGISQERHCLLVTATQTDAASYDQDSLSLKNFSEDKRKYAHPTAVYGLNQDKKGREKKLGLMRINELVVREDEFSSYNQVHVIQKLQIGRPFLGSFGI